MKNISLEGEPQLQGKMISLELYTLERCHEFWSEYISDYDMLEEDYIYDKEKVNRYYNTKVSDKSRIFFAICHNGKTVGEIQLKYIDLGSKHGTMSIHFSKNAYKNHGWGTEAEQLIIKYGFEKLGLNTIYADAVLRNTRSQHVLKKNGFVFTHEDGILRYYKLER